MPFESGEWYEGMRACFEFGEAPVLAYQNFALFSEKTFGVFVFETSNPPYVVGNTKRGGPREVPWRYGSNTNPAGRQELLTMLLPRLADPESEVLTGEFRVNFEGHAQLRLELFMYPAGANGDSLVIPFHRVTVRARDEFGNVQELPKSVSLVPPRQHSSLAKLLDAAVALPGPSKLELVAQAEGVRALRTDSKRLEIICSFRPAHFSHDVAFSTVLSARQHPDHQMYWEREEQHSVPLHTNADVIDDLKQQLARFAPKTKLPTLL
ncbi:MAG: hypothetical protein JOZ54_15690 [Acidobacteria bacterium]|nr:hypothetical protein [Acidobacteriota bacterium]